MPYTHFIQQRLHPLISFLNLFDHKRDDSPFLQRVIIVFFLFCALAVGFIFLNQAFQRAYKKPLWADEPYSLEMTVRRGNIPDMIVKGAREQASPAPLDYIFLKIYDNVRPATKALSLPESVYYRLHSVSVNFFSGLIAVFWLFRKAGKNTENYFVLLMQAFLLLAALVFYYFWYFNFQHSLEMRPYALWNALWFLVIAGYIYYGHFNRVLIVLLVLLGLTSSGAIFQMAGLMAAVFITRIINKEKPAGIVLDILKKFSLPVLICLYYISKQSGYDYDAAKAQQYYREFYHFWITKEMVPILSSTAILFAYRLRTLRPLTVIALSYLILYLLSPVFNALVISKGQYFSSRQYLFYDLIYPLFLIVLAMTLPVYFKKVCSLTKPVE